MRPAGSSKRQAPTPGRLSQALTKLLMRQASVVAVEWLADRFRLITLEGEALRDVAWAPGQKIQVSMGSAFVARTYTPITWNPEVGRTCLVAFEPGHGPGSEWVSGLQPGDICSLFGPRASLDLRHIRGPIVLFGDETSIGVACALVRKEPMEKVTCLFEVDDVSAARQALGQIGLHQAELFGRERDEAHLGAMEAKLPHLIADGVTFILTGKAGTVQRLRQDLKRYAVPSSRILTKAYWTPGKSGLD